MISRYMTVLFLLAQFGPASTFRLCLLLERDTVVPYEPLIARVQVVNAGSAPAVVTDITGLSVEAVFSLRFETAAGEEMRKTEFMSDYRTGWKQRTLQPGEALTTGSSPVGTRAGLLDPETRRTVCFPPGKYLVRAKWQDDVLPADEWQEQLGSPPVEFTVVRPTHDQRQALNLYRDLVYFDDAPYWLHEGGPKLASVRGRVQDQWARVEKLAREIISEHPVEPYVVLAKQLLAEDFVSRAGMFPQFLEASESPGQWRDSLLALDKDIVRSYPDSHLAAEYLGRIFRVFEGTPEGRVGFLRSLRSEFPGTRVGRAAADLLQTLEQEK